MNPPRNILGNLGLVGRLRGPAFPGKGRAVGRLKNLSCARTSSGKGRLVRLFGGVELAFRLALEECVMVL